MQTKRPTKKTREPKTREPKTREPKTREPKTPRVDSLFRAFSDKTRLRLLYLLQRGELCVCELVDALDVPQPTASRHLGYLRRRGLVLSRKEGLWSYYRLAPAAGPLHQQLLACLAKCFGDLPELVGDARRLAARRGGSSCCGP